MPNSETNLIFHIIEGRLTDPCKLKDEVDDSLDQIQIKPRNWSLFTRQIQQWEEMHFSIQMKHKKNCIVSKDQSKCSNFKSNPTTEICIFRLNLSSKLNFESKTK